MNHVLKKDIYISESVYPISIETNFNPDKILFKNFIILPGNV